MDRYKLVDFKTVLKRDKEIFDRLLNSNKEEDRYKCALWAHIIDDYIPIFKREQAQFYIEPVSPEYEIYHEFLRASQKEL